MKFSIIIPVRNNFYYTLNCITSVFNHTKDFELIVIDNGSTDETPAYLQALIVKHHNVKVATYKENQSFAKSCNTGMEQAKGDYIILLNNDTLVTPNWAEQLTEAIPRAEKEYDASPIGLIGPRTNSAGGGQAIPTDPYDANTLNQASIAFHKKFKNRTTITGFLSGMCLMITKQALDDIGLFDERYKIGGVEDLAYCLAAQLKGWKLAIDDSTFIHHEGSQTLKQLDQPYAPIHHANKLQFLEKHYDQTPKKLIVTIRVRDQLELLKKAITRNSLFADEIIILADRCTEYHPKILEALPKVNHVIEQTETTSPAASETGHGWDLYRDRSLLMTAAIDAGADWIFALDADEILEDSFTYDYVHQLMNPLNPSILAYSFKFCTFFLGNTHYRTDGIFGRMRGTRMWRVLPKQHPRMVRSKRRCCLHCPVISTFNTQALRTRIKHYGYDSQERCEAKYNFYTNLDPNPDKGYIGDRGYKHLIDPAFSVNQWKEKNDLTLCMIVRNEELNLFQFLDQHHTYFDDIVIVDTGSRDNTKKVAQLFTPNVYSYHWKNDFSAARNFAKSKCTTSWILSMDPDEAIDPKDFLALYQLLEQPVDAWLFQVLNPQKDNTVTYSDNTRLLRNIPELFWSFRVHEKIAPAVRKNHLVVAPAPFTIKHYGYLKDTSFTTKKTKAYRSMLRKDIKEYPKEASTYFHFAFHMLEEGKPKQALEHLKKTLQLQPDFFLASKELGLMYLQKSLEYFKDMAKTVPQNHYFHPWAQQITRAIQNAINLRLP